MPSRTLVFLLAAAGALLIGFVAHRALREVAFFASSEPDQEALQEFAAMARALRGRKFDIARIEGDTLVTFAARARGPLIEFDRKESLSLESIIGRRELHQHVFLVERRGSTLRFTLAGSVADQFGVLYAPEPCLELDEIATLSVILGHPGWYEFATQR
jgi:hypothetical protein